MSLPQPHFAPAELIDQSLSTVYARQPGDPALDASRPITMWKPAGSMAAALQAGQNYTFWYVDTSTGTMRMAQATATPAWMQPNCPDDGTEDEPTWSNLTATEATQQQPGGELPREKVSTEHICLKSDAQGILLHSLEGSGITGCVLIDRSLQNFPAYEDNGEPRRWWVVLAEDGTELGDAAILLAQMTGSSGKVVPGTWKRDGGTLTWTAEPTGWVPPGMKTVGRPCVPLPDGYGFAVVSDGGLPQEMVVDLKAGPTAKDLARQIIALAQQI